MKRKAKRAKKMTNVRCDKCGRNFFLIIKERKTDDGCTERYFCCPFCKAEYTVVKWIVPQRIIPKKGDIDNEN